MVAREVKLAVIGLLLCGATAYVIASAYHDGSLGSGVGPLLAIVALVVVGTIVLEYAAARTAGRPTVVRISFDTGADSWRGGTIAALNGAVSAPWLVVAVAAVSIIAARPVMVFGVHHHVQAAASTEIRVLP